MSGQIRRFRGGRAHQFLLGGFAACGSCDRFLLHRPNGGLILTSDAFTAMRQKLIVVIADGKTETKGMGTPHFEPHGWIHQWANDGDAPLVLLQANISEEGVPAVVMVQPPSSGPTR